MDNTRITSVPVWEKYLLTVCEATEYFGIGEHKLRELLDSNVSEKLSIWNGNRQLIKRRKMEEYPINCDSI